LIGAALSSLREASVSLQAAISILEQQAKGR
jgi:hypothetical protein